MKRTRHRGPERRKIACCTLGSRVPCDQVFLDDQSSGGHGAAGDPFLEEPAGDLLLDDLPVDGEHLERLTTRLGGDRFDDLASRREPDGDPVGDSGRHGAAGNAFIEFAARDVLFDDLPVAGVHLERPAAGLGGDGLDDLAFGCEADRHAVPGGVAHLQ